MLNTLKTQAMKRLMTIGLMLASAFALTNCAEEIAAPVQDDITVDGNIENTTPPEEEANIPFDVFANFAESADTKTHTLGNHTYWDSGDQISVFHKPQGADNYNLNNAFTIVDVQSGKFSGSLTKALGQTNDWYFIYPSIGSGSSSGTTNTIAINKVQIGAAVQTQIGANNKDHLDGNVTPMWGHVNNLTKITIPDINMEHIASVIAIKIVNKAHGSIYIKNAEIRAAENIVGEFNVNISDNIVSFTENNCQNSNCAYVELNEEIEIAKGASATIYLAVKPFVARKGTTFSILINHSIRTITSLENDITFTAGKVTTLNVPVKPLVNETATDGSNYLTDKVNCTSLPTSTINGKTVEDIFVIGTEKEPGSVTISGYLNDIINVLPIGFYVSSWNDRQGALIIDRVHAYIDFKVDQIGMDLTREAVAEKIGKDPSYLVIRPYPMGVFTGVTSQQNLLILDEEPLQKAVDETKANTFIEDYNITIDEVRMAINAPLKFFGIDNRTDEEKLAQANLFALLCEFSSQIQQLSFLGDNAICCALKLAECSVTLRTGEIGEEGANDPRVVMWGLDINGAN